MKYGEPTTLRYPRTMRQSGTEYANSIERTRRHDAGGKTIVFVCVAVVVLAYAIGWASI